jgi:hypothetical protein
VKRDNWREGRKRVPSNPDPTPSSSESEGSKSDSEERNGRKDHRRSERVFERSFRKMADVLQLTATKSREKEKKRSSVFSAWTDDEQTLLRLLSSDGFRERRLPELTKFTKKMTADKKATKAIQMMAQESQRRRWEGRPMDSAVALFLSQGFSNFDILVTPQGFAALTCTPREHLGSRGEEARAENIAEVFGNGKLSQKTLEGFAKVKIHPPNSYHEAVDQISIMLGVLDLVTGRDSIGSKGYRLGREYLLDNREAVENAFRDDRNFLTKFLFMLDRHFQTFCRQLLELATGKDPLYRAGKKLGNFFEKSQDRELGNLEGGGGVPVLSMPSGYKKPTPPDGRKGKGGTPELTNPRAAKKKTVEEQGWHTKLPDPVAAWKVPAGKQLKDLFPTVESKAGFPVLTHHVSARKTKLCIPYFALGECERGLTCYMSHCKVSDLTAGDRTAMSNKFRTAYGST